MFTDCKNQSEFERLMKLYNQPDFIQIPESLSRENRIPLYDKIIPSKNYDYWQVNYIEYLPEEHHKTIFEKGTLELEPTKLELAKIESCFYHECEPMLCCTSILAVEENNIDTINTEESFRRFIGDINNLEEALLIAKTYGYWYDYENMEGGSYYQTENEYVMKLFEFWSYPHTWYSIKAIIDKKTGKLFTIDKSIYKKENVWSSH